MSQSAALFGALAIAASYTLPAYSENASVTGTLALPNGKAVQGYPVIINGRDTAGNTRRYVATTDKNSNFKVEGLPAGTYAVAPANEPGATGSLQIEAKRKTIIDYFNFAPKVVEKDIGQIEVTPGDKLKAVTE